MNTPAQPTNRFRRGLPILIGGVAGVLVLLGFYQPNVVSAGLLEVGQIVIAAGVLLGVVQTISAQLRRIRTRQGGRVESLVLVIAAVATFALQLAAAFVPALETAAADLFRYVYQPLAGSILALLTFFALRAAWRILQVRPGEGMLIVGVAAFFLLAGGPWAAAVPGLAEALEWTRSYPVLGVARGLLLGVGLGAMVASVRLLLGFDQPYFDR